MYLCNIHNKIIKFRNRHVSLNSNLFPKSKFRNTYLKFSMLENDGHQGYYARDFVLQNFPGPIFIPCPASIPVSSVVLKNADELSC